MAIKQLLVDDIDQSEGATTVLFSYKSNSYEIDLGEANDAKLEKALAPFIKHARKKGAKPKKTAVIKRTTVSAAAGGGANMPAIRDWAITNQIRNRKTGKVATDRGKIPQDIVDQFNEAHTRNGTALEFSG